MRYPYKNNTLELARTHRRNCCGEHCTISLNLLRMMAEECGVVFTEEEQEEFA